MLLPFPKTAPAAVRLLGSFTLMLLKKKFRHFSSLVSHILWRKKKGVGGLKKAREEERWEAL